MPKYAPEDDHALELAAAQSVLKQAMRHNNGHPAPGASREPPALWLRQDHLRANLWRTDRLT